MRNLDYCGIRHSNSHAAVSDRQWYLVDWDKNGAALSGSAQGRATGGIRHNNESDLSLE